MLKIVSKLKISLNNSNKLFINFYSSSSFNVFDRDLKRRQRNQSAVISNYSDYEYVYSEVGSRVADRVFDIKRTFNNILDLGCHRGHVSKHLSKEQAEAPTDGVIVEKKVFDEENDLPFADDSLDLVVSSLSLHWVNNLPKLYKEVIRCLKKDSAFIGALFAGDTLFELRVSMQLAELERKGGITARVSPFTTAQDIGGILSSSGFRLLTLDFDEIRIAYPSIFELMYDIKGMGESNCTWQRKLNLNKDLLMATQAIYKEMYGNEDNSIPATYQILYFIGWKPDESQAKPAKRGSGQVSFKDMDKVLDGNKK